MLTQGWTALHWAVSYNKLHIIKKLVELGADITITTSVSYSHSPLYIIVINTNYMASYNIVTVCGTSIIVDNCLYVNFSLLTKQYCMYTVNFTIKLFKLIILL